MPQHSYLRLGKRLLHQTSSSPAMIRHALVKFQGQGSCDPRIWYQVCRIPATKPDLMTEIRSAILERLLADALTTATDEKHRLKEERGWWPWSRADATPKPSAAYMKLLGEKRNSMWKEQERYLDKIWEKTQEVAGIEDVHRERYTAQVTSVTVSDIPSVGDVPGAGVKGFTGSIDDVQLHWYGTHKPLLTTNVLFLHRERFGKVMHLWMERNPVPGSDELSVKYTVPEAKKIVGDEDHDPVGDDSD